MKLSTFLTYSLLEGIRPKLRVTKQHALDAEAENDALFLDLRVLEENEEATQAELDRAYDRFEKDLENLHRMQDKVKVLEQIVDLLERLDTLVEIYENQE